MKKFIDWSGYQDQGMGDAYADIPKHGEDYAKAISVCIRSGICQEPNNRGVMCPSFKISGDVAMSPGGRVAILKKLLNQDDSSFLTDQSLAESLDNCVSCKGCKRECENSLDMATIKAEYLAQKKDVGLGTKRSWLFAQFPFLLYQYPFLAPLIRLRNKSPFLKLLGKKLFAINERIPLPLPELGWRKNCDEKKPSPAFKNDTPSVVLLVDSLTAMFQPESAVDAEKLLKSAGYCVKVLHPLSNKEVGLLDSGRTLFSQGFVEEAKEQAAQLLKVLTPFVESGHKVIGLEPSSLLMLRDEFLLLGLGEEAQKLSKQALMLEEFIAREVVAGRFQAKFRGYDAAGKILVHGHCHQKAIGAMKSMRKALRLIPELPFQFLDVSCCGMAGSYGLESEHAEQSLAMANLELLPLLDQEPEAEIVSNGFTCNHQIFAQRGRKPIHLATLLLKHLKESQEL